MVGSNMGQKEVVYSKTSKNGVTLNLYAVDGRRDYSFYKDAKGKEIITDDKLFLLEIVDTNGNKSFSYPFYTYDIAECAYSVISNKVILSAKQKEADKIIQRINDALKLA